jgi:hypothetical protein
MSTIEFPAPGASAGITSQIELNRSRQFVFRNSRFLCFVTMSGSFFAAIMGVCMVLAVLSQVFRSAISVPTKVGVRFVGAFPHWLWSICVLGFGSSGAPWRVTVLFSRTAV